MSSLPLSLSLSITLIYFNGHVDSIVTRSAQTHTTHNIYSQHSRENGKAKVLKRKTTAKIISISFSLFLITDFYLLLCCAHLTKYIPPTITIVSLIGAGKRFYFLLCFLMMEQFSLFFKPKAERIQFDKKVR